VVAGARVHAHVDGVERVEERLSKDSRNPRRRHKERGGVEPRDEGEAAVGRQVVELRVTEHHDLAALQPRTERTRAGWLLANLLELQLLGDGREHNVGRRAGIEHEVEGHSALFLRPLIARRKVGKAQRERDVLARGHALRRRGGRSAHQRRVHELAVLTLRGWRCVRFGGRGIGIGIGCWRIIFAAEHLRQRRDGRWPRCGRRTGRDTKFVSAGGVITTTR